MRHFGRFQLLRLLGKSARTLVWLADDPRVGQEVLLAMPRSRPPDADAADRWRHTARKASRIDHPSLAHVIEVGVHDQWPYIAYDRGLATVLSETLGSNGQPAHEMAPWAAQVLEGLAFAHEAGLAHHDLQTCMVLMPTHGPARLLGLGVALEPAADAGPAAQAQRRATERDVLAFGLVMHHALAGHPALDQPDVSQAIDRLPPAGRDIVRLGWTTAHPVPDAMRAIVNRATDRQERRRYRNARTVLRALEGWLQAEGEQGGGPMALLLDRMRSVGLLPASPGGAERAARMVLMERERNAELAEVVLQDVALSFEMMRLVNSAQVRGVMASGSAPILTIRRAIDMLGLDGVRRAALSLRAWPGPLNSAQGVDLQQHIDRAKRAGRIAQWLRPAGYDGEVVYLLALMQNLGRLVVRYHFSDEAMQIERLMKPAPPTEEGEAEEPGMTEEGASFAVLGIDIASIGQAIGRHWGLDEGVLRMILRVPPEAPVHASATDDELLRLSASCANEVVDVADLPAGLQPAALNRVAQRYGRALHIGLRDVQMAAQGISPDAAASLRRSGAAGQA
ncbi:HDOD domain-containing protein [Ideonella sp. A 288]|uniref:serine/threonine protein kinase n=1 Tax=Ideonella sp. A 288 TaxID=1962181 RepID=UPI001F3E5334|nr:HDOD domain-containing protein [Ideonella sp. A 288]